MHSAAFRGTRATRGDHRAAAFVDRCAGPARTGPAPVVAQGAPAPHKVSAPGTPFREVTHPQLRVQSLNLIHQQLPGVTEADLFQRACPNGPYSDTVERIPDARPGGFHAIDDARAVPIPAHHGSPARADLPRLLRTLPVARCYPPIRVIRVSSPRGCTYPSQGMIMMLRGPCPRHLRGEAMMTAHDLASAADGLFVIETADGDAFIGHLEFDKHSVAVHNGFVGRPPVVPQSDVLSITPAAEHPDVVIPTQQRRT